MSQRLALPNRRNQITRKVRIAGQRTIYIVSMMTSSRQKFFFD